MHPKPNVRAARVTTSSRCKDFEWAMACAMLAIAATVAIWPLSVATSSFYLMGKMHFTPGVTIMVFGAGGLLRGAALIANGKVPFWGPLARALGGLLGALAWSQMMCALLLLMPSTGAMSMGVPFYAVVTAWELHACYRAAVDARSSA
jgi:hypothetical protein